MSGFTIYAFSVLKGILAISEIPGRTGNYQEDLEHISDWKPSIVISMTSTTEMAKFGASDFGAHISDRGSRWVHFPVDDMNIPVPVDPDHEDAFNWETSLKSTLQTLKGGGRVLVHCQGGCGRSGMLALRLMIMAGEDPNRALKRLRNIRPCAIETDAQLKWARAAMADADLI